MAKILHRISLALAGAYLVALVLIVFWPTPVDKPAAGTLHHFIAWMHLHGVPGFIGYNQIEFSANIVLFVPMGFIASVWSKNAWVGLVTGALASCLIELSQAWFLPARFASGLDVLSNTMGAGIGAAIYWAIHVWHARHTAANPAVEHPAVEPVETSATPKGR